MYSTFGRGGDPERDRRGAGGGGLSVSWPHLSFDDPPPALRRDGPCAVELRIRRCTCHSPRWTPRDGFCQEQDGGLMHSYWRLAVALLTIGELSELGAVDGPQLELRFKAAQPPPTRPCPSVRAGRPNPCGQDPRLLERARHDETEQQVSLPDLASRVHARLQRPRAGGLPMPCIIPRPRPRPRRRPRCCRCPRASPGPAEKP